MCNRVATPDPVQFIDIIDKPSGYKLAEGYQRIFDADGFTRPYLPVTLNTDPRLIQSARWKLIPHWVKTEGEAAKSANTLNARCEDIFSTPSYKGYITRKRALLWVSGFFEPNWDGLKNAQPYYVHSRDGSLLTLGCVWCQFNAEDTGETYPTFSIITTTANELMKSVHTKVEKTDNGTIAIPVNRMPLVIPADQRDRWLSDLTKEEITEMMVPLPDGLLDAYPVSKDMYKRGIDTNKPEILQRVELDTLF